MPTFEYRATDPHGNVSTATIEADSVYDATERIRTMELDLLAIEAVDQARRYEPVGDRPPAAPREMPDGVRGVAGQWVLVVVGSIFTVIASIFILIGLGLLSSGNEGGLFMVLFPLIHLAIGIGLLYWSLSRRAARRRLYREGVVTMAKVDAVGYNRSVRVNGRSPYEIVWTFEVDGAVHHDKRSAFNEAIPTFLPGDRMWVLYDPADPEQSVEWPPL